MEYTIKEMLEKDWSDVKRIYVQGLNVGISTFQTVCPSWESWNSSHLDKPRLVIVADELVVGWAALSPTSSREVYKGVVEVSIYVDSKHHGNGLGTRLLDRICREAEILGYWTIYASIFSINYASIAIHKKCGFREIGYRERIAKDRFDKWQNTTILERRSDKI